MLNEELSFLNIRAGSGINYLLLPNKIEPRWLIPLSSKSERKCNLLIYEPTTIKGKFFKFFIIYLPLIVVKILFKKQIIKLNFKNSILNSIYNNLDTPIYSFYLGNRSKHSKITVQVAKDNKPYSYLKFTSLKSIQTLFRNEFECLKLIERTSIVSDIPHVHFFQEGANLAIFATSSIRSNHSVFKTYLSASHIDFLARLYSETIKERLSEKLLIKKYESKLHDIISNNPEFEILMKAFEKNVKIYAESGLHFCLSHGDFSPWNIYFENNNIKVFDWEYADENSLPFFDLLHFIIQFKICTDDNFNLKKLVEEIRYNVLIHDYCDKLKIDKKYIIPFCILYLIDIIGIYSFREKPGTDIPLNNIRFRLLKALI